MSMTGLTRFLLRYSAKIFARSNAEKGETNMGVESYLSLVRRERLDVHIVKEFVTSTLGLSPDPRQYAITTNDSYYVFQDGRHVIEFELADRSEYVQVSVRFALCHPASVDEVFIDLTTAFIRKFDMTATICEWLPEGAPTRYDVLDCKLFALNCRRSIEYAREQWRKQFGTEEAGLSISDACQHFFFRVQDGVPPESITFPSAVGVS